MAPDDAHRPETDATRLIARRPDDAPPSQSELVAGTRLDHYVIEARRGGGGFATVYRARDERSGQVVAIKVLHAYLVSTQSILRRFQREADTIARLEHPGIVRLLGHGRTGDLPYLVMEWIDGATLAELLRERDPFAIDEVLPILDALADALAAAHALGVVHRDLKAANVAIAGGRVKLFDFGVAKLLDVDDGASGFTTAGTKIGTPHYMAPEQIIGGTIDHRVDIYALGILVFELLTGRRPFDAQTLVEIEEQQLREPPPAASRFVSVPPAIDQVIRRAMAKDPAQRPASAPALVAELRAAAGAGAGIEHAGAGGVAVAGRAPGPRRAVALYVHGAPRGEDAADDALDLLDRALARVRAAARALRLEVATETASALLLVGLPAAGESIHELADRVERLAREIASGAEHLDLVLALTIHVADVEVGRDRGGFTGGPLLDLPRWTRTDASGVFVTPAVKRT